MARAQPPYPKKMSAQQWAGACARVAEELGISDAELGRRLGYADRTAFRKSKHGGGPHALAVAALRAVAAQAAALPEEV